MTTPYKRAHRHVTAMCRKEQPFEQIEHAVETAPGLDDDERAMLWLYAWVGAEPTVIASSLGRPGRTTTLMGV